MDEEQDKQANLEILSEVIMGRGDGWDEVQALLDETIANQLSLGKSSLNQIKGSGRT